MWDEAAFFARQTWPALCNLFNLIKKRCTLGLLRNRRRSSLVYFCGIFPSHYADSYIFLGIFLSKLSGFSPSPRLLEARLARIYVDTGHLFMCIWTINSVLAFRERFFRCKVTFVRRILTSLCVLFFRLRYVSNTGSPPDEDKTCGTSI